MSNKHLHYYINLIIVYTTVEEFTSLFFVLKLCGHARVESVKMGILNYTQCVMANHTDRVGCIVTIALGK